MKEKQPKTDNEIIRDWLLAMVDIMVLLPKNKEFLHILRKSPLPHPTEKNTSNFSPSRLKDEDIDK